MPYALHQLRSHVPRKKNRYVISWPQGWQATSAVVHSENVTEENLTWLRRHLGPFFTEEGPEPSPGENRGKEPETQGSCRRRAKFIEGRSERRQKQGLDDNGKARQATREYTGQTRACSQWHRTTAPRNILRTLRADRGLPSTAMGWPVFWDKKYLRSWPGISAIVADAKGTPKPAAGRPSGCSTSHVRRWRSK